MRTSTAIRAQIEESLSDSIPQALSPRLRCEPVKTQCGIAEIDAIFHGGLSAGIITELVGAAGSGRTTAALVYAAAVMQTGSVCAWIDAADALDPESVAACGVDLERLLWVRCGDRERVAAEARMKSAPCTSEVAAALEAPQRHTGGGSPHPRSEGRNMPEAVGALLQAHGGFYDKVTRREKRSIGTPGVPNRPLSARSEHREEQVNSDRLPPRRGDNLALVPRCSEPLPVRVSGPLSGHARGAVLPVVVPSVPVVKAMARKPWPVLDQALRATDLLLQGGGFSAIVLDLGSSPPEAVWRIPLATWFRFRTACERTRVSLLLLTQHPCARSAAGLVVRLQSGTLEAEAQVMTGIRFQAAVERSRDQAVQRVVSIRKPPQSAPAGAWKGAAAWVRRA